MRAWNITRLGALAGVGFVVLNVIGNLIAGSPPSVDDPPTKIVSFFHDNHREVAISVIFTGAAAALFLSLIATLALQLRAVDQAALAVVVFALAVGGLTMGVAGDALFGTLARVKDPTTAQALYNLDGFLTVKAFWLATGAALLTGIAAWNTLPRWYAMTSVLAGILFVLGAISVRQTGALAPLGALTLIAFIALLVWALATSAMLWSRSSEPATSGAAASPAR
jgi:hypothetical protein